MGEKIFPEATEDPNNKNLINEINNGLDNFVLNGAVQACTKD